MTTQLVVVEDDVNTLTGLVRQVLHTDEWLLRGQARSYEEADELLQSVECDLVVLDLDLEGVSAIPLIDRAVQRGITVLVLSNLADQRTVLAAIRAGASGYLLKDDALIDLTGAVQTALAGESPISPQIASIVLKELRGGVVPESDFPELSKREQQILHALAQGLTYQDIADQLHLSYHTISDHTKSIYRKLQVNSRGQAVAKLYNGGFSDKRIA